MSNRFNILPADLDRMAQVARVSSRDTTTGVVWTEIALYWREHATRPWVAVVEGKTSAEDRVDRFKAMASGTLDRACNWFEPSGLTTQLLSEVEQIMNLDGDIPQRFKDEAHQRARYCAALDEYAAAARNVHAERIPLISPHDEIKTTGMCLRVVGITTDSIREAVTWLYPDDGLTDFALAKLMQRDFSIGERNVRNALAQERDGQSVTGVWVPPFLHAMKCFDRELWQAGLATIANVEG